VLEAPEYERLHNLLETSLIPEKDASDDKNDSDEKSSDNPFRSWHFDVGPLGSALGQIFVALAWICVAVVVALMAYLVVRAVIGARSTLGVEQQSAPAGLQGEVDPERAPGELPADVYAQNARKLAAEGRFREAVAQLLLGAMSHIERAGWIRFRRGLTYRDYLRAARTHEQAHAALREIVGTYEPLGFGRRTATGEHFTHSLQSYEAGFRAIPQATSH
jgi:hypothetical protein